LTLSLDVICDVIYYLHHNGVRSAIVNLNNEAMRKLCSPSTYQDKKWPTVSDLISVIRALFVVVTT